MNYFMIGGDRREYGPVSAESVREWIKEGRANGDTLLRPEGETLWKPLRTFADFQNDIPGGASVPPPTASAPTVAAGSVPAEIPVRIGSAFSRACSLLAKHFGPIAGATLIVWMVLSVLMRVPLCGPIALWFLEGPIYGGYFLFILALIRGNEVSAGDVLVLARANFGTLAMASFIMTMLTHIGFLCCLVPGIYLFVAWLLAFPLIADKNVDMWTGMEWSRQVVTRRWFHFLALFIAAFLPVMVFHLIMTGLVNSEMFKAMSELMAERGTPQTVEAMVPFLKELEARMREIMQGYGWMWYARQLILLLTLPLGFGTFAYVYEDIFGKPAPRQNA